MSLLIVLSLSFGLSFAQLDQTLSDIHTLTPEIESYANTAQNLSCLNKCGDRSVSTVCYCDLQCESIGDCCFDYWYACNQTASYANSNLITTFDGLYTDRDAYAREFSTSMRMFDMSNVAMQQQNFSFYNLYIMKQKSMCSPTVLNSVIEQLCLDPATANSSVPLKSLYLSVYDSTTSTFYRNQYCALCNDIDASVLSFELQHVPVCPFEYDITTQADDEYVRDCQLFYVMFNQTSLLYYRHTRTYQWTVTYQFVSAIQAVYANTSLLNAQVPDITVYIEGNLCDAYTMPVRVAIKAIATNQMLSIGIFKNLNCFKYVLAQLNIAYDTLMTNLNTTQFDIAIEIFDLTSVYRLFAYYSIEATSNYTSLITLYRRVSSMLSEEQVIQQAHKQVFKEIPVKYRSYSEFAYLQYFASQIENPIETTDPLTVYTFSLNIQLFIDVAFYNLAIQLNQTLDSFYRTAIHNRIVSKLIKRYNLTLYLDDENEILYSIEFKSIDLLRNSVVDISIPIKFSNASNIEMVNRKLAGIIVLARDLYTKRFDFLRNYENTVINKIEIKNRNESGSEACDGEQVSFNIRLDTLTQYSNLNFISKGRTINEYDSSTDYYVFRLNSLNGALNSNGRQNSTSVIYSFNIKLNETNNKENFAQMQLCYSSSLKTKLFTLVPTKQELNNSICYYDSQRLYVFNDTQLKARHIDALNSLVIRYKYANVAYKIEIAQSNYSQPIPAIFLICTNSTSLIQDFTDLNSRFVNTTSNLLYVEFILQENGALALRNGIYFFYFGFYAILKCMTL